jgi:hypothetical protein
MCLRGHGMIRVPAASCSPMKVTRVEVRSANDPAGRPFVIVDAGSGGLSFIAPSPAGNPEWSAFGKTAGATFPMSPCCRRWFIHPLVAQLHVGCEPGRIFTARCLEQQRRRNLLFRSCLRRHSGAHQPERGLSARQSNFVGAGSLLASSASNGAPDQDNLSRCDLSNGNQAGNSCIFCDITQGDIDLPCKGTPDCYVSQTWSSRCFLPPTLS